MLVYMLAYMVVYGTTYDTIYVPYMVPFMEVPYGQIKFKVCYEQRCISCETGVGAQASARECKGSSKVFPKAASGSQMATQSTYLEDPVHTARTFVFTTV